MATDQKPPENGIPAVRIAQNLRGKAETRIKQNSDISPTNHAKGDSINQLLHDLQVHQIELEMQNEELRESHMALDALRTRYFDLYDLAPIGYLTLNEHGSIQQANLTLASLLGLSRSSLIKQPISKLILRADQEIYYLNNLKLLESGEPQSFDLRVVKNDNTQFWANLVITLAHSNSGNNDNALEIRVILNDISVRKEAEQALLAARQIAEKANLAKSEFLSSMSHELRTPLNAILGFTQLIESSNPPLTENQNRNIEHILKAGWYLLELINEILDLATIDSGKILLHIEALSLAETLNDVEAMLEIQAKQRGINMLFPHPDITYFVNADRVRVKQVFANLLSNAIKYNKPNGSVTVSYCKKNNQRIRVCVEDTGEGLTAENMTQLFQRFNRLDKEFSQEEGTGIGLVVSKRIVELMGGSIGVESTVGKGSVFWVELNLTDAR